MHWSHLALPALLSLSLLGHAQEANWQDWQPCPSALAQDKADAPAEHRRWELTLSPYTHHWSYSEEHRPVFLAAMDHYLPGQRFCGLALFRNSFGQPSAYGYVGQRWDGVLGQPRLFFKLTGGLIYGYKGEFKDKIPFNDYGIAPAIIPALGYKFNEQDSAQAMLLGKAGILFAYGRRF
jgi:hypothetical protein